MPSELRVSRLFSVKCHFRGNELDLGEETCHNWSTGRFYAPPRVIGIISSSVNEQVGKTSWCMLYAVQVTRAVKKELYVMKQLSHENINRFIGACIEPGHVSIVTQYCSRGSLTVPALSYMYIES